MRRNVSRCSVLRIYCKVSIIDLICGMIFFENMISALYGEATLGGVKKYFFNICHVAITEKTNSQISFSNLASYHLRSGGNRLLLKLCHRKSVSSSAG